MSLFYEAVKKYLKDQEGIVATEVLDIEEKTIYGGYCETCRYTAIRVIVSYKDEDGDTCTTELYEDFGSLIRELAKY